MNLYENYHHIFYFLEKLINLKIAIKLKKAITKEQKIEPC
jgi:hypothetical protein